MLRLAGDIMFRARARRRGKRGGRGRGGELKLKVIYVVPNDLKLTVKCYSSQLPFFVNTFLQPC